MKLITAEIAKKLQSHPLLSQDGKGHQAEVIVKFFNPTGSGTWLITEGELLSNGDYELFGYCHIHEWGWGTVLLSELASLRLPMGLSIERDMYSSGTVAELATQ